MDRYLEGTSSAKVAKRIFLTAINEAWPEAADLGYEDGGGDPAELEPDELAEIDDATAAQIEYAVNLWDSLPDIREEGQDPFPRIEYYVKSLRGWYNTWKLRGAKNQSLQWVLGKTEQHCEGHGDRFGCLDLAGTWHTAKWYREHDLTPGTPGSNTTCGGFNCDCYLRNKKGERFFEDELE